VRAVEALKHTLADQAAVMPPSRWSRIELDALISMASPRKRVNFGQRSCAAAHVQNPTNAIADRVGTCIALN
jgi:hypothetical protein